MMIWKRWWLASALGAALAVGCGDGSGDGETVETAGNGGSAGDAGSGDGTGGAATDCAGKEKDTACVVGETRGHCFTGVCFVGDCAGVGVGELAPCAESVPGVEPEYGGACTGDQCKPVTSTCIDGNDEGTPCWLGEAPPEIGLCVGGVCEPYVGGAPEIAFVHWQSPERCEPDAPGQTMTITVAASDPETPPQDLVYSVDVEGCTPDSDSWRTAVTCGVHLGPRRGEFTATDPQGNSSAMVLDLELCSTGCEGACPKHASSP